MMAGTPIGNTIKRLRLERDWTTRELAKRAGVTSGYVSLVERGKLPRPSMDRIQRLATAFGVSVDELLAGGHPAGMAASPAPDETLDLNTLKELRQVMQEALERFERVISRVTDADETDDDAVEDDWTPMVTPMLGRAALRA